MKLLVFIICISLFPVSLSAQKEVKEKPYTPVKVEAKRWVKGNNNQPWMFYDTRIIDNMTGYDKSKKDDVNIYGSSIKNRTKASGYFRVEKIDDRWWVIDPDGYYNIQRVVNSYRKGTSDRNQSAFDKKFGSDKVWMQETAKSFAENGFVGMGSWSNDSIIREYNKSSKNQKLSYCINLGLMGNYGRKRGGTYQLAGNIGYPKQTIFVFDPEFRLFCDSVAKARISQIANDPNVFGYFSDNELPFGMANLEGYLSLENSNDPGRKEAEKWLRERGISADKITDKERSEFAGHVADTYFQIVSEVIKKADPNHLYLGSRIHGLAKFIPDVMQAAGKCCDIVSINYYGVWTPSDKHINDWKKWFDKPFIVTEFYTKAMDSGLANTTGAGYTVHTQKDKGYAYQDFCLALLESKNCVGWHYFKYQDNDPQARGVDPSNIDSNKGIVNNDYEYYTDLMKSMKQLNEQVYSIINYFDN